MDFKKTILIAATVVALVWLLYPQRQFESNEADSRVVEIVYMGPSGPIAGAMEDAVREFERMSLEAHHANPTSPVYRVVSGQNAVRDYNADPTRFLVSVAGGMPPDVIYFDRFAIAEWASRGAFEPLDGFIASDIAAARRDTPRRESFYSAAWDEATWGRKIYGIPTNIDTRALLYNVDLLVRAGFIDERGGARPPRTWEELEDYAVKLCEYDARGQITRAGFIPDYGNSWLYLYGWSNDAKFLSEDGKTLRMNEPAAVEALAFMKRISDLQGGYQRLNVFRHSLQTDALDGFALGKVAMKIDEVRCLEPLAKYARHTSFAAAPVPRPKRLMEGGAPPVSFSGGFAHAIPSTARNKQGAWELIRFLSSERGVRILLESERNEYESQGRPYMPTMSPQPEMMRWIHAHYIESNTNLPASFKTARRQYMELIPHSKYRPITPVGQLMWNEQISATQAALYGMLSPQRALDEANGIVQRSLNRLLDPPRGVPIRAWTWFFGTYALLLLLAASLAFAWHQRRYRDGALARRQWLGGFVCASPWLVGFIVFGGAPMLFSLIISFCSYDMLNVPQFIGTTNYRLMFSDDRLMPIALANTLFMVLAVPLNMAMSLAIALLLNQSIRAMAMWRTFFYLPAIMPMVAAAVLWVWMFNPEGGLVNLLLKPLLAVFGVSAPHWLHAKEWSKPALVLMNLWAAGGGMIIWLAGLKSIPQSLYEAAKVDGATAFQQFRAITIPQLTPYIFFNLVMGLIAAFQIFGQAYVMTDGGPVHSTLFYVYHLFNQAFRYVNMGYASAMAWVLLLIILTLTGIQLKLAKRWVHYEAE